MGLERLLHEIEMPLMPVLVDMEWDGILIDRPLFRRIAGELTEDLARLEGEITRAAGTQVNLNSPKQLAVLLFEQLQLPVLKRTKTGPSTDADVLEQLAAQGHEVPGLILAYRELQKLKSTYVDVLPERINAATGRIHTSFNQTGAATGRLSSSDPNLQNIPVRSLRGEEIRKGFIPAPGCQFIVADYSQIELRLMAHLSGDPAFIQAFRSGGDIHRQTASVIFGVPLDQVTAEMRARAKTINFGTIYGQGAFALARQLGIAQEEAKAFITQYFERFSGVRAYLDLQVKLARDNGFVETLFGRRRYIPEINDKNFNLRSFAERTAQNTPLQGSAADLIKIAMIRIHGALRSGGWGPACCCRSTTSLCWRRPRRKLRRRSSWSAPTWRGPRSSTSRWWWTWASVPTGWRPSNETGLHVHRDPDRDDRHRSTGIAGVRAAAEHQGQGDRGLDGIGPPRGAGGTGGVLLQQPDLQHQHRFPQPQSDRRQHHHRTGGDGERLVGHGHQSQDHQDLRRDRGYRGADRLGHPRRRDYLLVRGAAEGQIRLGEE